MPSHLNSADLHLGGQGHICSEGSVGDIAEEVEQLLLLHSVGIEWQILYDEKIYIDDYVDFPHNVFLGIVPDFDHSNFLSTVAYFDHATFLVIADHFSRAIFLSFVTDSGS